jgi:hypothetical protein
VYSNQFLYLQKVFCSFNFPTTYRWHASKGTLPPYNEKKTIDIDDNSIASPNRFHPMEDDGERDGNQSTQDEIILLI